MKRIQDTPTEVADKYKKRPFNPKEFAGYAKKHGLDSDPEPRGLIGQQNSNQQNKELQRDALNNMIQRQTGGAFSQAEQDSLNQYDDDLMNKLGLERAPNGSPILDQRDENLLQQALKDPFAVNNPRATDLYKLMVDEENDEIRDPSQSQKFQQGMRNGR